MLFAPALVACTTPGSPEQRIEALVHARLTPDADSRVEVRVGLIRIRPIGDDLYEARFELDRSALDEAGIPHIARREETWLVLDRSDGNAEILRVDRKKLLAYPGTGPQIVCY